MTGGAPRVHGFGPFTFSTYAGHGARIVTLSGWRRFVSLSAHVGRSPYYVSLTWGALS